MARYFFDVIEDGRIRSDVQGEDFATLTEAKREACHGATTMAAERFGDVSAGSVEIRVRDSLGQPVGRALVTFDCKPLA